MSQEESEHNEVDGMKKGVDSLQLSQLWNRITPTSLLTLSVPINALALLQWIARWSFAKTLPNVTDLTLRIFLMMCVSVATCAQLL